MAFKATLVLCGLVLAAQAQYLGNSLVENNVVVNSGASGRGIAGGYGGAIGLNNGLGLGATGLGIASAPALGLGLNNGLGAGLGLGNTVVGGPAFIDLVGVSAGGVLPISSVGPVVPAGLNVVSDNAIEGAVLVSGQLPFLSAVAFEGALASAGSGAASCGCGNGNIGIVSETPAAGGLGLGAAGLGLGAGRSLGLGYGGIGNGRYI